VRQHLRQARIVLFAAALALVAACATPKAYGNFAQIGTTYSTALNTLLGVVVDIEIDTTSERLLQDDALSNLTLQQYQNLSTEDEKLMKIVAGLQTHVRLMGQYFEMLAALAGSDVPEQAKAAIGNADAGIVAGINKVSAELRGSDLLKGGLANQAGTGTKFVVNAIIQQELRVELEQRKELIDRELVLQEALLKALAERITHDLAITQQAREQRLVIDPLRDEKPISRSSADQWIANRRSVLKMKLTSDELNTASANVQELRQAFEDLVKNGTLSLERIFSLRGGFNALLSSALGLKG
jgi:hypothetical protein